MVRNPNECSDLPNTATDTGKVPPAFVRMLTFKTQLPSSALVIVASFPFSGPNEFFGFAR